MELDFESCYLYIIPLLSIYFYLHKLELVISQTSLQSLKIFRYLVISLISYNVLRTWLIGILFLCFVRREAQAQSLKSSKGMGWA
jgi:hypothetical protein